jgi:hypothetical protein
MKVASSLDEYLAVTVVGLPDSPFLFRGQSDRLAPLVPSLYRTTAFPRIEGVSDWEQLEDYLIHEFQRRAVGFLSNIPETTDRLAWLVIARHHGLPTRLLDWSESPLIALWFAVADAGRSGDKANGAVWRIRPTKWIRQGADSLSELGSDTVGVSPFQLSPRVTAQRGAFTIESFPDGQGKYAPIAERHGAAGVSTLVEEITIPGDRKMHFKQELARLGISPAGVLPDLDGIAAEVKWNVERTFVAYEMPLPTW